MAVFVGAVKRFEKTKISKLKKGEFFKRSLSKGEPVYRYLGKKRYYNKNNEYLGWAFAAKELFEDNIAYTKYDIDVVVI